MMTSSTGMMSYHDFEHGRMDLTFIGKLDFSVFQHHCLSALDYASRNYIKSWLVDLQNMPLLDHEQEAWLVTFLLPQLMMRMGEGNTMAVVISEENFDDFFLRVGEQGMGSYNSFLQIRTFCDRGKAKEWLGNQAISNAS